MQLYKEILFLQDRHHSYVEAVERDRLARQAGRPRRSLQATSRALARLIGLFF